ncbi:hypothetical protein L228DRAFT_247515 [Xylona heveae TC161]|uniref:BTB domain-containing protein n=1 Tax=Xylona heveae (strain CBS 132557 / TC161) TaxID=1328760 RepID=A0A165H6X2_XYLHT|nr:hypothetical protein L228DRAFT_247515 [Xylona heveae TC161]KZF23069.1 hypothetical protein L228DRAFT_247515 [Xylona heveae TC161]
MSKALWQCREKGLFTDITIRCASQEFKAHRVIISSLSEYFMAVCQGDWKENEENEILLKDHNPLLVEKMLHFLYQLDYSEDLNDKLADDGIASLDIESEVEDYEEDGDNHVKEMTANGRHEKISSPLVLHVLMYSMGDEFGIQSLKDYAVKRAGENVGHKSTCDNLIEAARTAYETTLDSDRAMRDLICKAAYDRIYDLVGRPDLSILIRGCPMLTVDLLEKVLQSHYGYRNRYR